MPQLSAEASRALGVLVEKAHTTPTQYPLTLNALVTGCNQKNNRHPVTAFEEDDVLHAVDELRASRLASEVMLSGSRVSKYKHTAREGLEVSTNELVILAELLLRGPQTVGELRGRASRMHTLESTEIVSHVLQHLAARDEPMVRELAPSPGSRASRWARWVCRSSRGRRARSRDRGGSR